MPLGREIFGPGPLSKRELKNLKTGRKRKYTTSGPREYPNSAGLSPAPPKSTDPTGKR
jgi:hypothetical protein